ncbi:MAG: ABC transporter permease [Firmicutes bacterium]|nr:ABC transporter permease [Bacillota bacterium]
MTKYIVRRIIGLLPLLFGAIVISFLLMRAAPGGPQAALAGIKSITQEDREKWLRRWCLQAEVTPVNMLKEFGGWLGVLNCESDTIPEIFFSAQGGLNLLPAALGGGDNGILHGDLGLSIRAGRPVVDVILERVPATLLLTTTALVLWVGIAVVIGTYAAVRRYSLFDQTMTFLAYVFYSLPTFWLGLMLIFFFAVFSVALGWVGTFTWTRLIPPTWRWAHIAVLALLFLPFAVTDELARSTVHDRAGPVWGLVVGAVGKLIIVLSWYAGMLLPNPPQSLVVVAPVFGWVLVGLDGVASLFYNEHGSWPAGAVFKALALAWAVRNVFPLLA